MRIRLLPLILIVIGADTVLLAEPTTTGPATATAPQQVQPHPGLWAAVTVAEPVVTVVLVGKLMVNFGLVNDTSGPVNTKIDTWKLVINGQPYTGSQTLFGNGLRLKGMESLSAGDNASFTYQLGDLFRKPGIYTLSWQGEGFASGPVVFRVVEDSPNATQPATAPTTRAAADEWGEETSGVRLKLTATQKEYDASSPNTLSLTLKNFSNESKPFMESKTLYEYKFTVKDKNGKAVPLTELGKKELEEPHFPRIFVLDLKPGEELKATVELNRYFEMSQSGTYEIQALRSIVGSAEKWLEVRSNVVTVSVK